MDNRCRSTGLVAPPHLVGEVAGTDDFYADGTDWAMFGTGGWAARDELPTPPLALVVYGDQQPLADTRELRADAAGLVSTGRRPAGGPPQPTRTPTTRGRGGGRPGGCTPPPRT